MKLTISIAGHRVAIENPFDGPEAMEIFRSFCCNGEPETTFITPQHPDVSEYTDDPDRKGAVLIRSTYLQRQIADWLFYNHSTILLHGVALLYDGLAYIFTAPPGTGKTTLALGWQRVLGLDKVTIINGDKPFLHITPTQITVHSAPWAGKEKFFTNISAPLGGIVVVERDTTCHIHPLQPIDALPVLTGQIHNPHRDDPATILRVIDYAEALTRVPVYRLFCNISDTAVLLSHATLTGKE